MSKMTPILTAAITNTVEQMRQMGNKLEVATDQSIIASPSNSQALHEIFVRTLLTGEKEVFFRNPWDSTESYVNLNSGQRVTCLKETAKVSGPLQSPITTFLQHLQPILERAQASYEKGWDRSQTTFEGLQVLYCENGTYLNTKWVIGHGSSKIVKLLFCLQSNTFCCLNEQPTGSSILELIAHQLLKGCRGIIRTLDTFHIAPNSSFIQPYCESHTLNDVRAYTDSQICRIAVDCLYGLHGMHKINLCHNDLSPSNIFLYQDQKKQFRAVLADFGLSGQVTDKRWHEKGNLYSFSPEKYFRGQAATDLERYSSDVYSLGASFLKALLGQDPKWMDGVQNVYGLRDWDKANNYYKQQRAASQQYASSPIFGLFQVIGRMVDPNANTRPLKSSLAYDFILIKKTSTIFSHLYDQVIDLSKRARQELDQQVSLSSACTFRAISFQDCVHIRTKWKFQGIFRANDIESLFRNIQDSFKENLRVQFAFIKRKTEYGHYERAKLEPFSTVRCDFRRVAINTKIGWEKGLHKKITLGLITKVYDQLVVFIRQKGIDAARATELSKIVKIRQGICPSDLRFSCYQEKRPKFFEIRLFHKHNLSAKDPDLKLALKNLASQLNTLHKNGLAFSSLSRDYLFRTEQNYYLEGTDQLCFLSHASKGEFGDHSAPEDILPEYKGSPFHLRNIFQLGHIFWTLIHNGYTPWGESIRHFKGANLVQEIRELERFFPKPADPASFEHTVWEMLQYDPKKRLTLDELQKKAF